MKAEEKVAAAMARVLETEKRIAELEVQLKKANTELDSAGLELERTCHAVFGEGTKQIIYAGCLWHYSGHGVDRSSWDGLIIGNGQSTKTSE